MGWLLWPVIFVTVFAAGLWLGSELACRQWRNEHERRMHETNEGTESVP